MKSFHQMFDKCPDLEYAVEISVNWVRKGRGFGSFEIYEGEDGKFYCYNEIVSKEFIKQVLCDIVDKCVLLEPAGVDDWPKAPPRKVYTYEEDDDE